MSSAYPRSQPYASPQAPPPVPPRPPDAPGPHARQPSLPPPVPPVPPDLRRSAAPAQQRMPWTPMDQMAALSFSPAAPPAQHHRPSIVSTYGPPPRAPSPPAVHDALTAPIPAIAALQAAAQPVQQANYDPASKIAWSRDVLFLVNRAQQNTSTDPLTGPVTIADPQLLRLALIAVPTILDMAARIQQQQPCPPYIAEAVYLRATLAASGAFPDLLRQNLRAAFRDFETAARAGYASAWFRLGRDYESFNDFARARDCFERGVKLGVESCCYRMGMAHLIGQLGVPVSLDQALPLLHRAATLASLDTPQPAYVYALLLLNEFSQVSVPPFAIAPFIPAGSAAQLEARRHLERAAFLHFSPAQYKLGHAYEFAEPPFPFDPLLSVQYYSLASQQGEVEADMALSKWFLCGSGDDSSSPGHFEKDEGLAWTFADKAARRGLPSAQFAMGYYAEVGVGGPKDINTAIKWYKKARDNGNTDAAERLTALEQSVPQSLSREQHNVITEDKLVRKRTMAKQRSEQHSPTVSLHSLPPEPQQQQQQPQQQQIMDLARRTSMIHPSHPPRSSSTQELQQPGSSPRLRPQHAGTQQYPNLNRYTLIDNPVPSSSLPATRNASPARPGSAGNPPTVGRYGRGGRAVSGGVGLTTPPQSHSPGPMTGSLPADAPESPHLGTAAPPAPRPHRGPSTFAEMGIQGVKLEEKECVIM